MSSNCSPPTSFPTTKTKGKNVEPFHLCITRFLDINLILGRQVSKMQRWSFCWILELFVNFFLLRLCGAYMLSPFIHKRAGCSKYNLSTKTFCISEVTKGLQMVSKRWKDIRNSWSYSNFCCFTNGFAKDNFTEQGCFHPWWQKTVSCLIFTSTKEIKELALWDLSGPHTLFIMCLHITVSAQLDEILT